MKRQILSIALALCLCISAIPAAYAADAVPAPQEVYNILIALKEQEGYKEGTPWDDGNHSYNWKGGPVTEQNITGGTGCAAFAFELSDMAFGSLPARTLTTGSFQLSDVRAGDILRVLNNTHSVIVLQANDTGVVVAEGNFHINGGSGMVHWNRTIGKDEVESAAYLITRYPEGYDPGVEPDEPIEGASGTFGALSWAVTNSGTLAITGTGAMPEVDLNNPPWKDYTARIVKIETGSGVTSISANAFRGSGALSAVIPASVKSIGDSAFRECANLISVTISEGVESIGDNAFRSCSALTSISVPASVRSVGSGAFFQCGKMTQASFVPGTAAVSMGDNLFAQCYGLSKATLPRQADRIGEGMFQNCMTLTSVTVPEGAAGIGGSAFASCSQLTQVWIPASVTQIGIAAFADCGVTDVYFGGSEAQWSGITKLGDTAAALAKVSVHYNAEAPEKPAPPVPDEGSHTHSWAEAWSSDSGHHWHECLAGGCSITGSSGKSGYGAHSYGGWVIDINATAFQSGSRHRSCTACGYTVTESIPAAGDSPSLPPSSPSSPSGSGSGSSGGGSSNSTAPSTTTTTRNPDGSTTTTKTDSRTGTVTATTKSPDGSQTIVEIRKDGTVTTWETAQDGSKTETVVRPDGSSTAAVERSDGTTAAIITDAAGRTEAEVSLSDAAVSAARQSGEAVVLPIPAVQAVRDAEAAPAVTVNTGSEEPVRVEIPSGDPAPGTVAVLVHEDGTEEVIKTSVPTAEGVVVSLPDGATVKLVDNSKEFTDIAPAYWASDAVAFVSARELFAGTGEAVFTPEAPMTRAMLMVVLARFDGADTAGGDVWYEKGLEWAVASGISDGSGLDQSITREQLVTMLWRYAGSPDTAGVLSGFADAGQSSGYAREALCWAVENGIISGFGSGQLDPQGLATRAQVAQILKNFIEMQPAEM